MAARWDQIQETVTRRFAALRRQRFYYGLPCPEGHTLRYTSCKSCVECQRWHSRVSFLINKITDLKVLY